VQFLDTNLDPTTKLILPIKEKLYITIFWFLNFLLYTLSKTNYNIIVS
jgi:hypothetical protein